MEMTVWFAFVVVTVALLLVTSYAIGHGRRVAVPNALGVALGDFVAMTASLAGLGALSYALLASRMQAVIARPQVIAWLTRTGGAALIAMGITTATFRRAT